MGRIIMTDQLLHRLQEATEEQGLMFHITMGVNLTSIKLLKSFCQQV